MHSVFQAAASCSRRVSVTCSPISSSTAPPPRHSTLFRLAALLLSRPRRSLKSSFSESQEPLNETVQDARGAGRNVCIRRGRAGVVAKQDDLHRHERRPDGKGLYE